jgi:hypothetical protein
MMSIEDIVYVNEKSAAKAASENKEPWVPSKEFLESGKFPGCIPELGYHEPEGWEKLDDIQWFVDHTGWGGENEPALTTNQFHMMWTAYALEHPDHGYAITECGQFQLYINAFRKV